MGKTKKTLLIFLIISIFTCGCPGILLAIEGTVQLDRAFIGRLYDSSLWSEALYIAWENMAYLLVIGLVLLVVPLGLLIAWLLVKKRKVRPGTVSGNDPIPPTS